MSDEIKQPATSFQTCSFLTTFPAEIRNIIYRYTLDADYVEIRRHDTTKPHCSASHLMGDTAESEKDLQDHQLSSHLNLLLLCRQITDEALPLLYHGNRFRFTINPSTVASKRFSTIFWTHTQRLCLDIDLFNAVSATALAPIETFATALSSAPAAKTSCHLSVALGRQAQNHMNSIAIALRPLRVFEEVSLDVRLAKESCTCDVQGHACAQLMTFSTFIYEDAVKKISSMWGKELSTNASNMPSGVYQYANLKRIGA